MLDLENIKKILLNNREKLKYSKENIENILVFSPQYLFESKILSIQLKDLTSEYYQLILLKFNPSSFEWDLILYQNEVFNSILFEEEEITKVFYTKLNKLLIPDEVYSYNIKEEETELIYKSNLKDRFLDVGLVRDKVSAICTILFILINILNRV